MALATWWTSDPLMDLTPLSNFQVRRPADDAQLTTINRITVAEVEQRRRAGHLPYVDYIDGTAATYGWVATREASIGELNLAFPIAADSCYLWDFATLPNWQGRGLYPRLLQAIVQAEQAGRFWIIHAPENLPSGAGMNKAGFEFVGQLSFTLDGRVGLAPFSDTINRARVGANLLSVPLIDSVLAPCWHCGGMAAKLPDRADINSCWPPKRMSESECTCAVVVKSSKSNAVETSR